MIRHGPLSAIVLAAGSGSRFGGNKLVQIVGERPLIVYPVQAALDARVAEVLVVVGADGARIAGLMPADDRIRVVHNPDHPNGMSTSIGAALRAASGDSIGAVILLGDEPEITAGHVDSLVAAFRSRRGRAVRALYEGRPGHPVVIGRELWDRLAQVTGDVGARSLFVDVDDVGEVPMETPAPIDVDVRSDLAEVRRRMQERRG